MRRRLSVDVRGCWTGCEFQICHVGRETTSPHPIQIFFVLSNEPRVPIVPRTYVEVKLSDRHDDLDVHKVVSLKTVHQYVVFNTMSAGVFTTSFYEADYDGGTHVHAIRVQPETLTAAVGAVTNTPTATAANEFTRAIVSGGRRKNGLHARIVRLTLLGAAPTGYSPTSTTAIPCLTAAFFNACSVPGAVVDYLGTTWEATGTTSEKAR